jgi:uncharacterized membrane protein YhaH (DUF805 family)
MNYFLAVLKKYAVFSGRARRSEYWYYTLFYLIFLIVAMVLDKVLGTNIEPMPYGAFYILLALGMFIPSLAVGVRRLHDIGKSGWMFFISFIPVIGAIWLIVLFFKEGTAGENEYGLDPKAVSDIESI